MGLFLSNGRFASLISHGAVVCLIPLASCGKTAQDESSGDGDGGSPGAGDGDDGSAGDGDAAGTGGAAGNGNGRDSDPTGGGPSDGTGGSETGGTPGAGGTQMGGSDATGGTETGGTGGTIQGPCGPGGPLPASECTYRRECRGDAVYEMYNPFGENCVCHMREIEQCPSGCDAETASCSTAGAGGAQD